MVSLVSLFTVVIEVGETNVARETPETPDPAKIH
jgi:hypothetical protein